MILTTPKQNKMYLHWSSVSAKHMCTNRKYRQISKSTLTLRTFSNTKSFHIELMLKWLSHNLKHPVYLVKLFFDTKLTQTNVLKSNHRLSV